MMELSRLSDKSPARRKHCSGEKSPSNAVEIEVFRDGIRHSYSLVKKPETVARADKIFNSQSHQVSSQLIDPAFTRLSRQMARNNPTNMSSIDFGSDYAPTRAVKDARRARYKHKSND